MKPLEQQSKFLVSLIALTIFSITLIPAIAFCQPLPFSVDVMCGGDKIGEFEITTYQAAGAGVEIEGCFNKTADCPCCNNFRFFQLVYEDHNPLTLPDGSGPCVVPYVDPPKGGYQGDPWDGEPWYNEPGDAGPGCAYPFFFYDRPQWKRNGAPLAGTENTLKFEAWVVCFKTENSMICGLAHIRWGYHVKADGTVDTVFPLDGVTSSTDAEVTTALSNGLFRDAANPPVWNFSSDIADCGAPSAVEGTRWGTIKSVYTD
jgi:hypothetical protein